MTTVVTDLCCMQYVSIISLIQKCPEYDLKAWMKILIAQGRNVQVSYETQIKCDADLELEKLLPTKSNCITFQVIAAFVQAAIQTVREEMWHTFGSRGKASDRRQDWAY